MSKLVLRRVDGPIVILTLNRPGRHNSLVPELLAGLLAALQDLEGQKDCRAVVLQANGPSFSTGGDLVGFRDHLGDLEAYAHDLVGLLNQVMLAMIRLPAPVVTAVHGRVTGGSMGLVLAADLVLVAAEASFTPYYGLVGFAPDGGWTALLPEVIGAKRTANVLLLNQTISATQALEWGLAQRLVPAERTEQEALNIARVIAGMHRGALASAKRRLWASIPHLAGRLEAERQQFVRQVVTEEARRGLQAFLESIS